MKTNKKLVVIAGPTAVGKTLCAIEVAKHFNTEIISADSRQIYRGLNIGTAKPDSEQLALIKHHFIDILDANQEFSAGMFEGQADRLLAELFLKFDLLIVTGGTGFYIDALINGLDDIPKADRKIRAGLMKTFRQNGLDPLLTELEKKDARSFQTIDRLNPHRVIRALEVIRATNKPYSDFRKSEAKHKSYEVIKIALQLPRQEIYRRINARVDAMMEQGLLDEVLKFQEFKDCQALQTVGYKELFAHLDGDISLAEAVELIKRNTRRYAKRQLTWLNRDNDYVWFESGQTADIITYIESFRSET